MALIKRNNKQGGKFKMEFDFSGYATRNDLLCADGRTIRKNAFMDNDGKEVPLVWNHQHNSPDGVLGHALLENREDGVYAYCTFNDTESGKLAKKLVQHGDIRSLSIYANKLKQIGGDVIHGVIRELSLVHAGANSGAFIDQVMAHSGDSDDVDGMVIGYDENIMLYHSADSKKKEVDEPESEKKEKEDPKMDGDNKEKTVADVFNEFTEEQKDVVYAMIGQALEEGGADNEDDDENGGNEEMKHNVFDNDEMQPDTMLSHSDEMEIIELAKQSNVGSLKQAMDIYAQENDVLAHGVFEEPEQLFPEYEYLKKGEPETLERDQSWIAAAISKIHKSPISRIRTRQADARIAELKAKGYQKKGNYKQEMANIKLIGRTTDPQTIYIKDDMHRDDIVDITDFDVVAYQWKLMRHVLDEELAMAALVGDGREEGDPDKIHEDHVRSIWHDDDLYCIHQDVDFEAAKTKLQGTNTSANFSENYIKAEAMIEAALYSREKFKGSGTPDLYCAPHLLNVMLLARDLNGRRIYDSKSDLAAALNVGEIHTVEQFEGLTRTTDKNKTKKLLGLFVNLSDYQFGSTKGGEITRFEDFDMDFNRYKYMLETRLSGSLTKLYSAIALEEDVTE
jgi:hypothetical protein